MALPTYARGIDKVVTIASEATYGTQGAGPGQVLRRTQSDLALVVHELDSQEIVPTAQMCDARQGLRMVQGTLAGQLSASTYELIFGALLRNNWATAATTGALADLVGSVDGNGNQVITSAAQFYTAKGLRKGDIIRPSNCTRLTNNANYRALTVEDGTLVLELPPGITAQTFASGAEAATATLSAAGKKLLIPATGQLLESFSIEHWYSDIGVSELFLGCRPTQATINIPASGFVSFQAQFTGQNMIEATAQALTNPTGPTSNSSVTAAGGRIYYNGTSVAAITSANLQISTDAQAEPVAGSNYVPDVFLGTFRVRGSLTALMMADGISNDFLAENEVDLGFTVTAGRSVGADVMGFYLPRVKLTPSTSTNEITRAFNFVALEQINASSLTGWDGTTITIIDSAA